MPTILESLYYGNLNPNETLAPQDPHYRHLSRQISAATDEWRNKLSSEEFAELEVLLDLYQERQGMDMAEAFSQGFKMGAGMVFEVYAERVDK